jgi:ornithine carbamoyltransferase
LDAGDAARDEIALFDRAAMALGAQVAHIRPNLTERSGQREIEDTAHMLGRLYDAVVCQGMASSLVRQLGAKAGIPVYDGIVSSIHPLALAADQLDPSGSPSDRWLFLLQALLVRSLG